MEIKLKCCGCGECSIFSTTELYTANLLGIFFSYAERHSSHGPVEIDNGSKTYRIERIEPNQDDASAIPLPR
jgi:hypothetical protein